MGAPPNLDEPELGRVGRVAAGELGAIRRRAGFLADEISFGYNASGCELLNLPQKPIFRGCTGHVFAGLLVSVYFACSARAQTPGADEFFEMRVRPVLAANCFACHTASKMGGLQMDSRESLLAGGGRGPAVVPGDPDQSLLIQAVTHSHAEVKMPLGGKLKPQEIEDLASWIKAGAVWPETIVSSAAGKSGAKTITPEQRNFWAFRPVRKPALPSVRNEAWVRAPLDRFVLAKLEAKGLQPANRAAKRTLIRRAYFDLIGLPPTPEQVDAFLGDQSRNAFGAVLDGLLASPHYGERWGRHWLDVARYSDDRLQSTQMDPYPNSFRYRDWVIQAFNDDMPYDLFVKAQIAGDLIAGKAGGGVEKERLVGGLGFYGLSSLLQGQDDRVDATARGFLALTVGCARCHDHKFDPIPTEDYYALLGIFKSTELDEYPLAPAGVVEDYKRQEEKVEKEEEAFEKFLGIQSAQLVDVLASQTSAYVMAAWQVTGPLKREAEKVARSESLDQETLERWARYLGAAPRQHPLFDEWDALVIRHDTRDHTPKQVAALADSMEKLVVEIIAEKKELDENNKVRLGETQAARKLNEIELLSLERDRYFLWRDLASNQPFKMPAEFESGILHYGGRKIDRFLDGVWRDHVRAKRARLEALREMMLEKYPFFHVVSDVDEPKNEHVHIRGNKANLGDEVPRRFLSVLSDGESRPFTKGSGRLELAEAIANPDNPLTARVMVNRIWLNHFGQALVRTPSNFGRMGERPSHPELLDYLAARFVELNWSIKALHREIMLSSTYALAAARVAKNEEADPENRLLWRANRRRLDVEAMRDSLLFVAGRLDPSLGGEAADLAGGANDRRTVYGYVSRRRLDTMLGLFDFPNPTVTSPRRILTSTPLQGLFFLNSGLVMEAADALAERLRKEAGDDDRARIRRAYRVVFGREPSGEEMRLGREFVEAEPDSWPQYAQALLSSAEFLHVN